MLRQRGLGVGPELRPAEGGSPEHEVAGSVHDSHGEAGDAAAAAGGRLVVEVQVALWDMRGRVQRLRIVLPSKVTRSSLSFTFPPKN